MVRRRGGGGGRQGASARHRARFPGDGGPRRHGGAGGGHRQSLPVEGGGGGRIAGRGRALLCSGASELLGGLSAPCAQHREGEGVSRLDRRGVRSEEHTSELQSLMRISYAVFCL